MSGYYFVILHLGLRH